MARGQAARGSAYARAPPRRRIPRRLAQVPPWPPCDATVEILAAMCSNPTTLRHYLARVRSVLHLLRAPVGVLDQTRGLVAGAAKCGDPASASAAQAWLGHRG